MLMIVGVGISNETGTNALFLLTMTESQSALLNIILHQYGPGGEHPLLPEKLTGPVFRNEDLCRVENRNNIQRVPVRKTRSLKSILPFPL